ncbi:MAG TPA: putative phage tail protein [Acetobacteraceae bacterium]|nr:putative phage tail protein [Acetobacteraceae bacterium]
MRSPAFTDSDYGTAIRYLMPTGRVWPAYPDTTQQQAVEALAPTPQRASARALNLLTDAFPSTADELLPEWEASLGLPDPCAGEAPTTALRQAQVTARFIAGGGQSIAYFVNFAKTLGYDITITQFSPFRVGASTVGSPLYGEAWAFVWQVNAPQFSISYFSVGIGAAGEPLATWGNTVLQCELRRLAPAHTTVIFNYS